MSDLEKILELRRIATNEKNKEYHKEYYRKNRERIIARVSEYQKENRDKCSEYQKKWRAENKDKVRVYEKRKAFRCSVQ